METQVPNTEKTVLELDLVAYNDVARELEEQFDVGAVKMFEDQIQTFVDHALNKLGLHRTDIVLGTAGDNAILLFDDAVHMHVFAQTVQEETALYNRSKSIESAKRWFRMGAATGMVLILKEERRIIGTTIARAVRLEAAASKGELVIDLRTFTKLPQELRECYGGEKVIQGKREEHFKVHRCSFIRPHKDWKHFWR